MYQKTFGYARVSSRDQNQDRQVRLLLDAGVSPRDIFVDKQSGKSFDRPQYQALVAQLRPGDTVILTSLDRLGRNYEGMQEQWRFITRETGAYIRVLDMPLLDTTPDAEHELDKQLICDLTLQILSYVAEKERRQMKERQRQGIEAAKVRGVHMGRPQQPFPEGFELTYEQWKRRDLTPTAAMARHGLSKAQFYYLIEKWRKKQK